MEKYINQYLRHCQMSEGQVKSTIENKKYSLQIFCKDMNILSPNDITTDKLLNFFANGKEKKLWTQNTYINYFKYIKGFTNFCISNNFIFKNPFESLKKPKKPKTLPRRLTESDAQKVLYTTYSYDWTYEFEKDRNQAIIALFLYAGLRISEVLHLDCYDVNIDEGTILIREGKGMKDRFVPIHPKLKTVLNNYEKAKKRLNKKSLSYFCSAQSDKRLTKKTIYRITKKIQKESGINFTPHQLRHTFASCALDNGLDIYSVKECLGHSNVSTTQIYLSMSKKTLQERMKKLTMYS